MEDVCKATGMTSRQVFQEARVAFVGMDSMTIRHTANNQFDDWEAKGVMPDYVEKWALNKLVEKSKRLKAQKICARELVPSTLFDDDCA